MLGLFGSRFEPRTSWFYESLVPLMPIKAHVQEFLKVTIQSLLGLKALPTSRSSILIPGMSIRGSQLDCFKSIAVTTTAFHSCCSWTFQPGVTKSSYRLHFDLMTWEEPSEGKTGGHFSEAHNLYIPPTPTSSAKVTKTSE